MSLQTIARSCYIIFFVILWTQKSLASTAVTEAPKIEVENVQVIIFNNSLPDITHVKYGQHIKFICDIKFSSPMSLIVWRDRSRKYTKGLSEDHKEFDIKSVNMDFHGKYITCEATLVSHPKHKKMYGTSIIISDLASPLISQTNTTTVIENDNITLTCKIVRGIPPPRITWQMKSIGENVFKDLLVTGEDLTIENASFKNAGQYRCIAQNVRGQTNKTIEVSVQKAPVVVIEEMPKNTYSYGDTAEFTCKIEGYLLPNVTWSHNKLANKHNFQMVFVLTGECSGHRKAKHLVDEDSANNTFDQVYPLMEQDMKDIVYDVIEDVKGRETILKIADFPPGVHKFNVSIEPLTKDHKVSISGTQLSLNVFGPDGTKTDVKPILDKEKAKIAMLLNTKPGNHTIEVGGTSKTRVVVSTRTEVKFQHGFSTFKPTSMDNTTTIPLPVILNKKAPTVSISGEPSLNADWNKPLQLSCKVNGYPQPVIVWLNRDTGEELPANVSAVELHNDFVSIVNIDKVIAPTNYECRATNAIGSVSKTIEVTTTLPHITVLRSPKDTSINFLAEGKIYCEVDAYPTASITWYKNMKPLLKNNNLEFSNNKSVITIKSMEPSDAGSYMCEVSNGITRKVLSGNVSIAKIEAPVINKTTMALSMQSGSDAVINCNVTKGRPKPSVTWFYGNGSSGEKIALDQWKDQETITIRNADKSDTGVYACAAKNVFGHDEHEVKLTVEYPPKIKPSNRRKEFNVAEGESVLISCPVDGMPAPEVKWYKDKTPLNKTENIKIYKNYSFRMTVNVSDSGTYTCNATNKLGTTSRVVKVNVHVPATITIPKNTKMKIKVGTTRNLRCNAHGYPTPKTEWTYHSFNLSVPPRPMRKSNGSSIIKLRPKKLGQDGYYTCTASNVGGQSNISYEIHVVGTSPVIKNVYVDKVFKPVEGDLVLMIKCKATGNPPPVIGWFKNGYWVATGADISIQNGTLIMKNINNATDGVYVCEAKNSLGLDREVYEVTVQKSPQQGHPTSIVAISEGNSSFVKCDVHHTRTNLLRWYKNGILIHTGELTLTHAKVNDSGIYTCRVSSFTKSTSGNTMVKVGFKPKFIRDEDTYVEYVESNPHVLDCEASGEPELKFTWWHNGEKINTTENHYNFEMAVGTQGQYVCEARNEFGNAVRTYNINSKDCLIDIKKQPSKLQPLMLTTGLEWPKNEIKNGFMSIAKDDVVLLFCQNQFKAIPNVNVNTAAICEGGTKFNIHSNLYEYSDIECTEKITHFIERTGKSCFTGNTELVRVVFKVLTETVDAYEVCLNIDNNRPLYTNLRMGSSVADTDYLETQWADAEVINLNLNEAYECDRQINRISSVLGRSFHRDDGCCFGKRQLVSPKDLPPGVAQGTAYSHLNVVPHWSTCNAESNNWNEIELRVRTLAKATYNGLLVSTGVAGDLALANSNRSAEDIFIMDGDNNEQIVPEFLWKVVQEPATNSSLVIIQVNVPDLLPSEAVAYVRCRDICNTTKWMRGPTWYDVTKGFTYCCSLNDFENKFGFKGVFEPYSKVLNDVSLYSQNIV